MTPAFSSRENDLGPGFPKAKNRIPDFEVFVVFADENEDAAAGEFGHVGSPGWQVSRDAQRSAPLHVVAKHCNQLSSRRLTVGVWARAVLTVWRGRRRSVGFSVAVHGVADAHRAGAEFFFENLNEFGVATDDHAVAARIRTRRPPSMRISK